MNSNITIGPSFNGPIYLKTVKEIKDGRPIYYKVIQKIDVDPKSDNQVNGAFATMLHGGGINKKDFPVAQDRLKKGLDYITSMIKAPLDFFNENTLVSSELTKENASFILKNAELKRGDTHLFYTSDKPFQFIKIPDEATDNFRG